MPADVRLPDIDWSDWYSIPSCVENDKIPKKAGVYLVSHEDLGGVQYVGRGNLQERIYRMWLGIDKDEMPYSDPHTAAPCLWAIAQEYNENYRVRYSVINDDSHSQEEVEKKTDSIKSAYLAAYRYLTRQDPIGHFGQMIRGYEKSTQWKGGDRGGEINNEKLTCRRRTDYPIPTWENWDNIDSDNWMGYEWEEYNVRGAEWGSLSKDKAPSTGGVILVWNEENDGFDEIIATSNLRDRIKSLSEKYTNRNQLRISFDDSKDPNSRFEKEVITTDLVGAYYLATNQSAERRDLDKSVFEKLTGEEYDPRRIECKEELPEQNRKIRKDIIAISNLDGGFLIVGVTDDNHKVTGVKKTEFVKQKLRDITSHNIHPNDPVDEINEQEINDETLVVAEIKAAKDRPYYRSTNSENMFYIRKEDQSRPMSGEDIRSFYERRDLFEVT